MDLITLERIKLLHPAVRKEVLDTYTHVNQKLLGKGVRLRFAYTLRTTKEQDELYAQGRTKLFDNNGRRLGIVTNAKGGQSIHNYSLAFDIVLLLDKNGDGVFEAASWDTKADNDKDGTADWMEVVNYFKSKGWVWGGDWKGKLVDAPHFEKTFNHTWRTLKAKVDKGDVIREVIGGVEYIYPKL
ncbi:M15 family metallopeptidase [Flavobacterium sp.]|uniref:M15 family metallopeptidase n=1 Tax=Flavobacterium sp. TaxID=239 RepID=UPI0040333F7B